MSPSGMRSGEVILHYQIVGRLGAGGMGVVFKALDLRLKRYVALKFLPPDLKADAMLRARLAREAAAASALEHSNIGAVHAIEETPQGVLFIVMSYYEGETLKQRLERAPLTTSEFFDYALQTARGLAEAHRHGIVHRDIKPSNLILTPKGVIKIVDFGLAKMEDGADSTQSMMAMGTVAYMSPEQALARGVDHRSDIWSSGVVFYQMLTGGLPFQGDSTPSLLYAVVHLDLPPLGNLPAPLQPIIRKCLSKSPAERYSRMEELIAALEEAAQAKVPELGTELRTVSTVLMQPPQERSRVSIWASIAVAALLLAGGTWLLMRNSSSTHIPSTQSQALPVTSPSSPAPAAPDVSTPVTPPKRIAQQTTPPAKKPTTVSTASAPVVYHGPVDGRLVWIGDLDAGQLLDFSAKNGSGSISGSLPGVPVTLEIHPDSVHVVTPPAAGNQWRGLVVRNDGKKQVTIVISWHVISQ